jgi:hypothetical protein
MLKLSTVVLLLFLHLCSFGQGEPLLMNYQLNNAQQKLKFGIGANVAYSMTRNISKEKLQNRGFSGDSFTVAPTIEHAIFGIVQYPISPQFELEVGLGYSNQKEDITIYPSSFLPGPILPQYLEKNLLINLYYLSVPIQVNYAFMQNSTGELAWLNVGLSNNFLIKEENNYNALIYEYLSLGGEYAPIYQCMANIGITKRHQFGRGHLDISLFGAMGLTKLSKRRWGFLDNIEHAKNVQGGLQLKYFFN